MFREEWRLHARLFGGRRFVAFPVVISTLVVIVSTGLAATGTTFEEFSIGIHLLVFGFGLYSGTAGFVGTDMLENVLGELSLVLASSTVLPLSRRRLLGAFLLKDALFYGALFILPLSIGFVPFIEQTPALALSLLWLWLSLFVLFVASMVVTITGISLTSRGLPGWTIGLGLGFLAVSLWLTDRIGFARDMGTTTGLSGQSMAMLTVTSVTLAGVSIWMFDPTPGRQPPTTANRSNRTSEGRLGRLFEVTGLSRVLHVRSRRLTERNQSSFARVHGFVIGDHTGIVTKTLLDLSRSSGGIWKPFISAGILFVVLVFLLGIVETVTGVTPAPGLFFGATLGLSAFTTYNWLTQFDDVEDYLTYPIHVTTVFRAKRIAFAILCGPAVGVPYVIAILWYGATGIDALVGALILVGYSAYFYGLTVYLAGFDPNEFLFDAVRFATFSAAVAIVLLPTILATFVSANPSLLLALVLGCSGLIAGLVGIILARLAGPRWQATFLSD